MDKIKQFFKSDLATGVLLMIATIIAIIIANSPLEGVYHHLISGIKVLGEFNIHMIVNDFFMAIFFLVVGIEIKNEILYGHLSSFKKASFPVIAAFGGVIVPALIFMTINRNTEFLSGVGIPISTDIAFALAVFMIFKNKLNPSLKIFLLSLAVVDDLISIFAIGILYSSHINYIFLIMAALIMVLLLILNRVFKVEKVYPYILIGLMLWFCVYKSGVHPTISGVLLAFVLPIKSSDKNSVSVANKIEHKLSSVSNLIILPLFAFTNTAINLKVGPGTSALDPLVNGIVLGLVVGKPLGVMLFSYVATKLNITEKPQGSSWAAMFKVAMLSGIGFTMSIFVSELAFSYSENLINIAKISILISSIITIILSYMMIVVLPEFRKKHVVIKRLEKMLHH
ncbi:MAG: Na+/H+ antiporter NhaA [Romboutsia sp.]